ncbi:hypothetical protein CYMTET_45417 [Cymbomonas tetramitiformis]|uniref:Uncharacterized protein n=1 Tax=Cymbomonas tetramitiformis TaxID=36881 RepID=A0AAE0C021_9CHLO|nr:hypothetical protein CYMTET_45417 [Cymbomonas tetramitiformis]
MPGPFDEDGEVPTGATVDARWFELVKEAILCMDNTVQQHELKHNEQQNNKLHAAFKTDLENSSSCTKTVGTSGKSRSGKTATVSQVLMNFDTNTFDWERTAVYDTATLGGETGSGESAVGKRVKHFCRPHQGYWIYDVADFDPASGEHTLNPTGELTAQMTEKVKLTENHMFVAEGIPWADPATVEANAFDIDNYETASDSHALSETHIKKGDVKADWLIDEFEEEAKGYFQAKGEAETLNYARELTAEEGNVAGDTTFQAARLSFSARPRCVLAFDSQEAVSESFSRLSEFVNGFDYELTATEIAQMSDKDIDLLTDMKDLEMKFVMKRAKTTFGIESLSLTTRLEEVKLHTRYSYVLGRCLVYTPNTGDFATDVLSATKFHHYWTKELTTGPQVGMSSLQLPLSTLRHGPVFIDFAGNNPENSISDEVRVGMYEDKNAAVLLHITDNLAWSVEDKEALRKFITSLLKTNPDLAAHDLPPSTMGTTEDGSVAAETGPAVVPHLAKYLRLACVIPGDKVWSPANCSNPLHNPQQNGAVKQRGQNWCCQAKKDVESNERLRLEETERLAKKLIEKELSELVSRVANTLAIRNGITGRLEKIKWDKTCQEFLRERLLVTVVYPRMEYFSELTSQASGMEDLRNFLFQDGRDGRRELLQRQVPLNLQRAKSFQDSIRDVFQLNVALGNLGDPVLQEVLQELQQSRALEQDGELRSWKDTKLKEHARMWKLKIKEQIKASVGVHHAKCSADKYLETLSAHIFDKLPAERRFSLSKGYSTEAFAEREQCIDFLNEKPVMFLLRNVFSSGKKKSNEIFGMGLSSLMTYPLMTVLKEASFEQPLLLQLEYLQDDTSLLVTAQDSANSPEHILNDMKGIFARAKRQFESKRGTGVLDLVFYQKSKEVLDHFLLCIQTHLSCDALEHVSQLYSAVWLDTLKKTTDYLVGHQELATICDNHKRMSEKALAAQHISQELADHMQDQYCKKYVQRMDELIDLLIEDLSAYIDNFCKSLNVSKPTT